MRIFLVFLPLFASIQANLHVLESQTVDIPVQKGAKVYFLSNSNAADLRAITVRAEKSNIDTNVYQYSVPQADGSLNPLLITGDDTLLHVTKPDGNTAVVSVYKNTRIDDLNVFPVLETSSIKPKNGANIFFALEKPNKKILTMQNVKVDQNQVIKAYSGLPGDLKPQPTLFFDSSVYKSVTSYQQVDIRADRFTLDPILQSSLIDFTVCFGDATSTLRSSGVIMSPDFPDVQGNIDKSYKVSRVDDNEIVSVHMNVFLDPTLIYDTNIISHMGFGVEQGSTFSSGTQGRFATSGTVNSIEVKTIGPYALQYYTNSSSENVPTVPPGQTTTRATRTTTSSSALFQTFWAVLTVVVYIF